MTLHTGHAADIAANAEIDLETDLALFEGHLVEFRRLKGLLEAGETTPNIFAEFNGPLRIPVTSAMVAEAAHALAIDAKNLRAAYR